MTALGKDNGATPLWKSFQKTEKPGLQPVPVEPQGRKAGLSAVHAERLLTDADETFVPSQTHTELQLTKGKTLPITSAWSY